MNPTPVYLYDLTIESEQQYPLTDTEEQEIVNFCNINNYVIVERVTDNLNTFTSMSDQTNLINLLSKINKGITVICYAMFRLTRDTENFLYIKNKLNKTSKLIVMEIPIDIYTIAGNQVYQITAIMDTFRWNRKYNKDSEVSCF